MTVVSSKRTIYLKGHSLHALFFAADKDARYLSVTFQRSLLHREETIEHFIKLFSSKVNLSREWPGTILHHSADPATVLFTPINKEIKEAMFCLGRRLSDWVAPNLPEDIALYRDDMSVLFSSVSHEGIGWFSLLSSDTINPKLIEH